MCAPLSLQFFTSSVIEIADILDNKEGRRKTVLDNQNLLFSLILLQSAASSAPSAAEQAASQAVGQAIRLLSPPRRH
ncbi:unnamed protein product [Calypogeia fissa]